MPRRTLSLEQMLAGVVAAIRNKRTPPPLKAGLQKRAEWLRNQINQRRSDT
jgi:hypothetical protein